MKLPTAVYTAHRGYAWSNIPSGITAGDLDNFSRMISVARGDFPDPTRGEAGVVSDGRLAAAFTIHNIPGWDANGRAADYGAFLFFPTIVGRLIDFPSLITHDFFHTPSRNPIEFIDYACERAAAMPPDASARLRHENCYVLGDPHAIGTLLADLGVRSTQWVCLMQDDGTMRVECGVWTNDKEM